MIIKWLNCCNTLTAMRLLDIFRKKKKPEIKKYDVFISYSRKDEHLLVPVIKLIRSLKADKVFQDIQDIPGGNKWRPALKNALEVCEMVIVFWCQHSAKSRVVKQEYKTGIKLNKLLLTVCLDKTPVPNDLSEFQWIDMSAFHIHRPKPPFTPKPGTIYNSIDTEEMMAKAIVMWVNKVYESKEASA